MLFIRETISITNLFACTIRYCLCLSDSAVLYLALVDWTAKQSGIINELGNDAPEKGVEVS